MPLSPGARLGPYEIVAAIGAGGMGQVYRAHDTRLHRDVAIKILPDAVASDPSRRARFERETHAIAQLSHPNICTLYDTGTEGDVTYLVMEFIEGDSLEQRLRLGPVPSATALTWGIQMASALDAAHRRGIVHRDLKPGNVMLSETGVKLVDFGLAKLLDGSDAASSAAPTKSLTAEQRVVGTTHYMSPEQLEGRNVDARTDIFSLGTTLYEMFTGRKPFDASSAASVIAAILTVDPPPVSASGARGAVVPAALDHVIRRALAKNPDERWQTARDLMFELQWIAEGRSRSTTRHPGPWLRRVAITAAALALAATGIWLGLRWAPVRAPNQLPIMLTISAPPGTHLGPGPGAGRVSPNGRKIAFLATSDQGTRQMWVYSLDSTLARQLTGADNANAHFWSPDSQSIGYYANNFTELRRISTGGGLPTTITTIAESMSQQTASAMWQSDDTIVFGQGDGLYRVPASGGTPTLVTPNTRAHGATLPEALPGGRLLYLSHGEFRNPETHIEGGSLKAPVVLPIESNAVFAGGFLLFRQGQALVAQPFDVDDARLTGRPVVLAGNVAFNPSNGRTGFSASADLLVYRPDTPRQFVWRDRGGAVLGRVGQLGSDWNPAIAPDEKHIAFERYDPVTLSFRIWTTDEQGREATPRSRGIRERLATWAPDSQSIVYLSMDKPELRRVGMTGALDELVYEQADGPSRILDYTRDNRFLIVQGGKTDDIWALPLSDRARVPIPLTTTPWRETSARVSPDGHWIAFSSEEDGRDNIWVQEFPGGANKRAISTKGGMDPSWRDDGKELFYLAPGGAAGGTLMVVPMNGGSGGAPSPLFTFDGPMNLALHSYAASPDGRKFLVTQNSEAPVTFTAIVNWTSRVR